MTDTEKIAGTVTAQNTAEYGSAVGIQAEQVHNSTVYQVLPDSSPQQKYTLGVRFLQDGVPARARDLITEAIAHGYEDGEVRFHWMLAMLSKRAYRDLTLVEREQLDAVPERLGGFDDDEWKCALRSVCELLDLQFRKGEDPGPALKSIADLEPRQRDLITRHLDLVLTGGAKDRLWEETRKAAYAAQYSGDRVNRVWAYFEPDPAEARAPKPKAVMTTLTDWSAAIAWSLPVLGALLVLGWAVLAAANPAVIVAYVVMIVAGAVCLRTGVLWHYRSNRLRRIERTYALRYGFDPKRGFAREVDHALGYYFGKYLPEKRDRESWLAATAGVRASMCDEVVSLYHDKRQDDDEVKIGNVRWLLRYMARDVRARAGKKSLDAHKEEWTTAPAAKLVSVISTVVAVATLVVVAVTTIQAHQVWGTGAVVALLMAGRIVVERWSRIVEEGWRFRHDQQEYDQVLAERQAEHRRWSDEIASHRPGESEMENWLTCDKTVLLDKALRHYKLAWRDVIAHAFLQTPAERYKRARVDGCPWRYSRYDMRLFLVTLDGMREYRADFDFEHVHAPRNERNNFRFDAVSSVGVVSTSELSFTLKLTLTNGPAKNIKVMDPTLQDDTEAVRKAFSEINLDAAGFKPTLHILEGIAAEGKKWIERDPHAHGPSSLPDEF